MTAVAALLANPSPAAVPAEVALRAYLDHPSGYLALSPRNQRFLTADLEGFIAYREQGRHLFLFGGVHAPEAARGELLDRFLALAAARRRGVVAVQLRLSQEGLFRSRGFVCNQLGTSYGLRLCDYTLSGTRRMKLRNKIKRARSLGVRICELGRELPWDARSFAALSAVSERWLRNKGKKELDFMIGELGGLSDSARRIFVATANSGSSGSSAGSDISDERWLGFITYVPVFGERPGYLHDLTRRVPESPPGTMELCNAVALERLAGEGVPYLHFGFTPFIKNGAEPPSASRVLAWLIDMLYRYGGAIYPAKSQADYKLKWGPELIEPELVAARPFSARAIFDLLLLTRSI